MKFRTRRRQGIEANLTPLIDVVFLLLIFFMVSTTFTHENQLRIELPEAEGEMPEAVARLDLVIQRDGAYSINGTSLTGRDLTTLVEALRRSAGSDLDQPLVISADAQTSHESVVRAMDAAGRVGLTRVRLASQAPLEAGP